MKKILTVGLTALLLFSCSPTKRLDRLIDKHPELSKTTTETIYIPKIEIDTFVDIRYDSIMLEGAIDSILITIPDCINCTASKEIVKYINSIKAIEDTLYFTETIENDSMFLALSLTVWQDGTYVRIKTTLEDAEIKYTSRDITVIDSPKRWPIVLGIVAALILLLLTYFRHGRL